jgi:hypothetical protein
MPSGHGARHYTWIRQGPRRGTTVAGLNSVQLRFATGLTSEEYVRQQAWRSATLSHCPLHPKGGCGFARHTPYERVKPAGCWVARYYCDEGHTTFSLLPDCLASRLSSTLAEVEAIVEAVETFDESREQVAEVLRSDIGRQCAVRWLRRRVRAVGAVLVTMVGLLPSVLSGCELTLHAFRAALAVERVLPALREKVADHLSSLPPPVGFGPRSTPRRRRPRPGQQERGADPPGPEA